MKMDIWRRPQLYFTPGQYLIADSAYPISLITVPSFKGVLSQDKTDFNRCIANARACNEHVMGMLKKRWRSLVELPVRIRKGTNNADVKRGVDWIAVCLILHNFLVDENDILKAANCVAFRGTRPS